MADGKGQMSSRLMTMKFMQRAAASGAADRNDSPSTPERSNKRPRKSDGSWKDSPSNQEFAAMKAAQAEEEERRKQAYQRSGVNPAETEWVLSFKDPEAGKVRPSDGGLNVVEGSFADIDNAGRDLADYDDDDEEEEEKMPGRWSFGMKKKEDESKGDNQRGTKRKSSGASDYEDSSDEEEEEDDEEEQYDPDDPTGNLGRQARAEYKERRKHKSAVDAAVKRHKQQKPNRVMTSISSGGGDTGNKAPPRGALQGPKGKQKFGGPFNRSAAQAAKTKKLHKR